MMTLEELMEKARKIKLTPEELEKQRISFAYYNAKLSNPAITREMFMVIEAAKKLKKRS